MKSLSPNKARTLNVIGICLVQLDVAGKICRNEVYFDRYDLLSAITTQRAGA